MPTRIEAASTTGLVKTTDLAQSSGSSLVSQDGKVVRLGTNSGVSDTINPLYIQSAYLGGSAAANLLDDYEEGTWTPVLTNGGSVSVNNAQYTKIGKMVYVGAYLHSIGNSTAIPNDTARFEIGGLPFAVIGGTSFHAAGAVSFTAAFNWDAMAVDGMTPISGGSGIYFNKLAGASVSVKNNEVQGLDQFIFALVYLTSD